LHCLVDKQGGNRPAIARGWSHRCTLLGWPVAETGREVSAVDGLSEDSRARRPRRRIAVLPAIVATASVQVVTSGGPIVVVAPSPADHIVVALRLASVAEAVVHRGGPEAVVHRGGLEAVVHRGLFRGVPAPSRRGAFGLLYRGGLEKVSELAMDPSPLRGRWLGHISD